MESRFYVRWWMKIGVHAKGGGWCFWIPSTLLEISDFQILGRRTTDFNTDMLVSEQARLFLNDELVL